MFNPFHLFHHGLLGILGGVGLILLYLAIWVFIGTTVVGFVLSTAVKERRDIVIDPKGMPVVIPETEAIDKPLTFFMTIFWPVTVLFIAGYGIFLLFNHTVGSNTLRIKVANYFLKRSHLRKLKRDGDGW